MTRRFLAMRLAALTFPESRYLFVKTHPHVSHGTRVENRFSFFSLHMHRCRPLLFGFRFACMCHDIFLVVAILRQRESRRRATMSPPTAADYKLAQLGPFHPTVQEKWLFHYRSCKLVIRFHFTAVSVSIIYLHNHNCKQQQTTHPSLTRQRSHTRSYVPYGNNVLQASFTGWRGYHRSSARRD